MGRLSDRLREYGLNPEPDELMDTYHFGIKLQSATQISTLVMQDVRDPEGIADMLAERTFRDVAEKAVQKLAEFYAQRALLNGKASIHPTDQTREAPEAAWGR